MRNRECRFLFDKALAKCKIDGRTFVRFAYFYAGKEKDEKFVREKLIGLLNHDEVPDEVVDLALDVMTNRVAFEFTQNPHNGNAVIRFRRLAK